MVFRLIAKKLLNISGVEFYAQKIRFSGQKSGYFLAKKLTS